MRKTNAWLLAIFLLVTSVAQAQNTHEISGSTSGGAVFRNFDKNNSSSFYLSGGYDFKTNEYLQLGTTLAYEMYRQNSTTQTLSFLMGPTVNFSSDLSNAIYARLHMGLVFIKTRSADDMDLVASLSAGKRISLSEKVSLKPHVAYTFVNYSPHPTHAWSIIPLSLSVFID